ncbi:hypothetical protein LINGRAHAP2_LOCUS17869 [Linum grandiflorum]
MMCFSVAGRTREDPLPQVVGLEVAAGEEIIIPGTTHLQACGFSQYDTVSCVFSWLRISEDGTVTTIEGADSGTYQVSEDDVDFYVAVRVQPLDSRGRKGEVAQAFANGGRKIAHFVEIELHEN